MTILTKIQGGPQMGSLREKKEPIKARGTSSMSWLLLKRTNIHVKKLIKRICIDILVYQITYTIHHNQINTTQSVMQTKI